MSLEEEHKQRVRRFFEAMNAADGEAIADAYCDDGYVLTMGDTLISGKRGKQEIAALSKGILQAFPEGVVFTITGITCEGERVAVEAESDGIHVSGQHYRNSYHFLFEFRDGKILVLKEYMDTEMATAILCGGQRPATNP